MKNPVTLHPLWLASVLCLLLLGVGSARGQAPAWQWATSPGGGIGTSTVVDGSGNVYVTGYFSGTVTFGTTTLTSAGLNDVFVTKLTSNGVYLWAVRAGGGDEEKSVDAVVDSTGNLIITGQFASSTATFGTTTLINTSAPYSNTFVAKLTPTGAWQWVSRAGSSNNNNIGNGIAVDSGDDVVITGSFDGTITFGPITLTNMGAYLNDVYVAKLTSAGAWQWATSGGGTQIDVSNDVTIDSNDNVIITGSFVSGAAVFGPITLTSSGFPFPDIFVAKLTPGGVWQWAVGVGSTLSEGGNSLAADNSGNILVTGYFDGPATFGATTLTSAGNEDIFVAKLSSAGAWMWATSAGGAGSDISSSIAVDGSGNGYITGTHDSRSARFGTTTLPNFLVGYDSFVAKITPAGAWQWAAHVAGLGQDYGYGLAVDSSSVVVTGSFNGGSVTFGSITLSNSRSPGLSTFIARLGANSVGLPSDAPTSALTLAPNPAHHTVQLTGAPGPTATLLDALGRVVRTVPLTQGAATLEVRGLPAGVYGVRAGAATRRLVVE